MAPDIQRSKKTNRTVLLGQITVLQKWLSVANNTETPLHVSFFFRLVKEIKPYEV